MFILLLAAISQIPLVRGQFQGSDEARQYHISAELVESVAEWQGGESIRHIAERLTATSHPPLRYLMSAVGLALFPGSEVGLRFLSILGSFWMTLQVFALGRDLGGPPVGLASGVLIACSAVYNWTSMAFGWSITVVMLILCIRLLRTASSDLADPTETRAFYKINLFLIVAFLINTGNSLFVAMTGLLYAWKNRPRYRLLFRRYLPVAAFYALYYGYFMVAAPLFSEELFGHDVPAGQYLKNGLRAQTSHLNLTSLLENIRGLNAYFFPLLGVILFAVALVALWRRDKKLLIWFAPYLVLWSFYFAPATQQYIVLAAIAVFPFAVCALCETLGTRRFVAASALIALLFGAWNAYFFIRPYTAAAYPDVMDSALIWAERHHNIVYPFEEIAADLDAQLLPGNRYSDDISGSFSLFYHRSAAYAGRLGSGRFTVTYDAQARCTRLSPAIRREVRVVITERALCADEYTDSRRFQGTTIRRYTLR